MAGTGIRRIIKPIVKYVIRELGKLGLDKLGELFGGKESAAFKNMSKPNQDAIKSYKQELQQAKAENNKEKAAAILKKIANVYKNESTRFKANGRQDLANQSLGISNGLNELSGLVGKGKVAIPSSDELVSQNTNGEQTQSVASNEQTESTSDQSLVASSASENVDTQETTNTNETNNDSTSENSQSATDASIKSQSEQVYSATLASAPKDLTLTDDQRVAKALITAKFDVSAVAAVIENASSKAKAMDGTAKSDYAQGVAKAAEVNLESEATKVASMSKSADRGIEAGG